MPKRTLSFDYIAWRNLILEMFHLHRVADRKRRARHKSPKSHLLDRTGSGNVNQKMFVRFVPAKDGDNFAAYAE
ncbi:hypothetical protein DDZ14_12985 [Maritimibacter sp. 55A14]|nr:hypothetical protein DDZ14_12985 [Maritimibacter sp. 55A14]